MNERNMIMKKNIKVIGYGLWVMVALLLSAPTQAQQFENEQPQVQFQSTSTLQGSGSTYSSTPTLNEDGTAYNPAAASSPAKSGPRRILPGTPSTEGDPGNVPVGDAVLPLALMAMAFAGVVYFRRKREAR